mgnify:CR=1 FL=1
MVFFPTRVFVLHLLTSIFLADGIDLPFNFSIPTDFPFDVALLEKIRRLDAESFRLSSSEILKTERRNYAALEKFIQDRRDFMPYANWGKFGRVSTLKRDISVFDETIGGFDHSVPNNDIFQVRCDVLENVNTFSRRLVPNFLSKFSEEVKKSILPIHVGEVATYLSNFVDEKICPDAVSDPDCLANSLVHMDDDGDYILNRTDSECWKNLYMNHMISI